MNEDDRERFSTYLASQDAKRMTEANERWESLTEREQLLVKESAVLGYVLGARNNVGRTWAEGPVVPNDREIVIRLLTDVAMFEDLYPTLGALGTNPTIDDDGESV